MNWRSEITGDVKRARGSLKGREIVGGWWEENERLGNAWDKVTVMQEWNMRTVLYIKDNRRGIVIFRLLY